MPPDDVTALSHEKAPSQDGALPLETPPCIVDSDVARGTLYWKSALIAPHVVASTGES
jgi:hypothetical protein